eukprot:1923700-Alexandrium_andersonii.AAC.1
MVAGVAWSPPNQRAARAAHLSQAGRRTPRCSTPAERRASARAACRRAGLERRAPSRTDRPGRACNGASPK